MERKLGLAIALALGVAIAAASVSGSPLAPGAHEARDLWSVVFLAAAASAFAAYVAALVVFRSGRGSLRAACVLAVVIQTLPLAGPLLLSRDAYSYWAYGRIVLAHDGNPYVEPPARFAQDPATRAVAWGWRDTTSVYGPAFTAASVAVAAVAGTSRAVAATLFRVIAAFGVIAAGALAATLASRKAFAFAFVAWNPLLAIDFAGGGHNDVWMVGTLLAALVLASRRRELAAGGAWIAAASVKAPALVLLPLAVVPSRRRMAVGAAAATVLFGAAATLWFGTSWLSAMAGLASREAAFSIPSRLAQLGLGERLAFLLARAALVVGAIWLVVQAVRGRRRLALGAGLVLATSPWILPWYAVWPVGLAAAEDDVTAQVLALALALYVLPDRVPF